MTECEFCGRSATKSIRSEIGSVSVCDACGKAFEAGIYHEMGNAVLRGPQGPCGVHREVDIEDLYEQLAPGSGLRYVMTGDGVVEPTEILTVRDRPLPYVSEGEALVVKPLDIVMARIDRTVYCFRMEEDMAERIEDARLESDESDTEMSEVEDDTVVESEKETYKTGGCLNYDTYARMAFIDIGSPSQSTAGLADFTYTKPGKG